MTDLGFERGDRVMVTEENITPWYGIVNAIKPSKVSGVWVDVDRDGQGVWAICLKNGTQIERVEVN